MKNKVFNRCISCYKFKKWEDLIADFTPDTAFTVETIEFTCKECIKRHRLMREKHKIG